MAGGAGQEPKARTPEVHGTYGHFSDDGTEYVITDPRPPRPWANVIANPRIGLTVSQAGSGFTWIDNSQLAVITAWRQDFAEDTSGKFLYLRDAATGEVWSLSPAPTWVDDAEYECRHGLGYTTFRTVRSGIAASWTLFCHPEAPVELWRVELTNLTATERRLEICAYLEWCVGVSPAPRREFHKLFIETRYAPGQRAVFATNHMWDVPSPRFGHWNASFPYTAALAGTLPIASALGDKTAFIGRNGRLGAPRALAAPNWPARFGRHEDPIAALRSSVELPPHGTQVCGYGLVVGDTPAAAEHAVDSWVQLTAIDQALDAARSAWRERLKPQRATVPEPGLQALLNHWLPYQAISARLWGRCGYYQQSGAFGFRDQLQDSQIWLPIDPERCRNQIALHARHQFQDGSVYHWWHPLSEQGHVTRMTDDLLWLGFVIANYIKETGRLDVLDERAPFLDDPREWPLVEHVRRAFERVFQRTSPRGIPYIGAGDWNDGLSAVGLEERGESFWMGHFLAGLLSDWSEIHRRRGDDGAGADYAARRERLVAAVNAYGWDGGWYLRATLDDGSLLGSAGNRVGRIFLNAQVWAVLSDVAPPERARQCMAAVRQHLVSHAGALLLAPAFDVPVPEIGYITRYAPGLRENGGVYTHAATWAIAAAAKVKDADLVAQLLTAIDPTVKHPEQYWAEPYVLPGNVDGPDSPYHGRAGWTWYTGSAAWLQRVVLHWVLGVRPTWDGVIFDPCLPPAWGGAQLVRPYRGCILEIAIERDAAAAAGTTPRVTVDGRAIAGNFLPATAMANGGRHRITVSVG